MRAARLGLGLLLGLLAGCEDVPMPYDLLHPRVIAVQTEPAALAAEESATISMLVGGSGGALVVLPDELEVTFPPEVAAMVPSQALARDAAGWQLTAPDAQTLADARGALGLADDDPLAVPLRLTTTVDGVELTAEKWVRLGEPGANPEITGLAVDGTAATTVTTAVGTVPSISVTHDAGATGVIRWLSSVGDLEGYQRDPCELDAAEPATGQLVVVVRNDVGGTAWQVVDAVVE